MSEYLFQSQEEFEAADLEALLWARNKISPQPVMMGYTGKVMGVDVSELDDRIARLRDEGDPVRIGVIEAQIEAHNVQWLHEYLDEKEGAVTPVPISEREKELLGGFVEPTPGPSFFCPVLGGMIFEDYPAEVASLEEKGYIERYIGDDQRALAEQGFGMICGMAREDRPRFGEWKRMHKEAPDE